jgi:multidrug resistance efflux pump
MPSEISTSKTKYVRRTITLCAWIIVAAGIALALSKPVARSLIQKYGSGPETTLAGSIRPHSFAAINSQFPGQVTTLHVTAGQKVNAGDPLLTLENPEFEMEYERAKGILQDVQARISARTARLSSEDGDVDLRSAEGTLKGAEQRLSDFSLDQSNSSYVSAHEKVRQMQALVDQQLATDTELQQAQALEEMALRNLRSEKEHLSRLKEERDVAQARVQSLRNARSKTGADELNLVSELRQASEAFRIASQRRDSQKIVSTISGTVLRTSVNVGDQIPSGFPLLQVGQLELLDVDVPVAAQLANRLKVGQSVNIRIPTEPPVQNVAPISSVMLVPAAEQSAYTVRITMKNPSVSTVLVGLTAEVEFPHTEASWRAYPF